MSALLIVLLVVAVPAAYGIGRRHGWDARGRHMDEDYAPIPRPGLGGVDADRGAPQHTHTVWSAAKARHAAGRDTAPPQ